MSGSLRPEAPQATRWSALWQPFWALPAAIAVGSLLLGVLLSALDGVLDSPLGWVFHGGADGARAVLGTIAGAMISVTGLVFSITMVVLQLAASQFTPRILGTFLELRVTQVTLGVFTGSFLYSLSVLRTVRGGDGPVPETAVAVAYLFVVAAVGMFLAFIHHITTMVQVSRVMSSVRQRSLVTLERLAPDDRSRQSGWSPRPGEPWTELVLDDRCGYLTVLDGARIVAAAAEADVVVDLALTPGEFLVAGQPLGRAWGTAVLSDEVHQAVLRGLAVAGERSHHHDLGFGVRQLLDIAERALSPGINDPTTALQSLDQLHVILRRMATHRDPSPYLTDEDGVVRAVYRPHGYAVLLQQSVDELVHYGSDSVRVLPELARVLADLELAALPEHREVTGRARAEVERRIEPTALRDPSRPR